MLKLNKIVLIIFLLSTALSFAQNDKESVYKTLKSEYSGLNTVHIIFGMSEMNEKSAELYAMKGGKMHLSLKNNVIISDGKSIWNISPGVSATVSDYEDSKEMTLESIFFGLMDELVPITYSSLKNTSNKEKYSLKLKPKERSEYAEQLRYITLYFGNNQELVRVTVDTPSGVMNYTIKLLEKNPKIDPSKFNFTPTKDIEVIDFR
jgi:outer membrane lipoprotein-sorting protein